MKFTINRNKWRCGGYTMKDGFSHGKNNTCLLNKNGYQCCLGFVSQQLGFESEQLLFLEEPYQLKQETILSRTEDGKYFNTDLSDRAIKINDNTNITLKDKEICLKNLFEEYGHGLEFEGEYEQ